MIKKDNNIDNIEYSTPKQNVRHSFRNGRKQYIKLNKKKVLKIRELIYSRNINIKNIASIFNVDKSTIYLIRQNKIHKNI